ncbi:PD-(D/E)XK nuclease superfamily protein [Paramaledivibacter caminithermalis DSM 15212]|uniref:PD-(D/E)XK nuclease superfamily protein n=2 Tax=Paramaledivibacter TaxID=1884934 RepID=A0A1M6M2A4_PARC5|nr:PD-(D/E)XK nuclease superfamily protein [Paramaledivibacter caminithermalis DSM 15212]
MHLGLEKGIDEMEKYYYYQYPVISDKHINEMIKLMILVEKALEVMQDLIRDKPVTFEYEIDFPEFKGFVDLIIHNKDSTVDIYDFKYSNNIDHYLQSKQLHLYKYYLEKLGFKVKRLGFIFIPKTSIRQKKTEDLYQFRKRLKETLSGMEVKVIKLDYDHQKVEEFFNSCLDIESEKIYEKSPSRLCNWCEFQKYCEEEIDYMLLPKNERREKKIDVNPDMWLYADSYVGKSTFVDKFDDLLFLNTDGNTDNTTSPVIKIADEVTYEGRLKKVKMAWEVFLDAVSELEKKDNTFKRVCIDLVEDLYEHCRLYIYKKLNIDHEQDAGFGKGWDMVRTEFLSAMKRLKNLGYQIIYISKELNSEITLKNGNKITTIKPNINDKVANVLAGTVDLTVRAYIDGKERFLQLEKKENIFGGGRFEFKEDRVKLDKEEFIKALKAAQEGIKTYSKVEKTEDSTAEGEVKDKLSETKETATETPEVAPEKTVKKSRRSRK